QALGHSGVLPPYLAAWLGDMVFGTIGVIMMMRARSLGARRPHRLLRDHRVLHGDGLPFSVSSYEDPRDPDAPAERESPHRAGVVGDRAQDRDVAVDAHRRAVEVHARELEHSARDVA